MKYIVVLGCLLFTGFSYAEKFTIEGEIYRIGAIMIREESDFIVLDRKDEVGSCPKPEGYVVARIPYGESGDRAYSIALAAKLAGKPVHIAIDDTNKHPVDGGCMLQSISLKKLISR